MFLHLSVSHSVHGGGGVMMSLPVMESTPGTAPPPSIVPLRTPPKGWHTLTVNKRAVRILLECFLVELIVFAVPTMGDEKLDY